jgi:CheY-like chemotaxis protein
VEYRDAAHGRILSRDWLHALKRGSRRCIDVCEESGVRPRLEGIERPAASPADAESVPAPGARGPRVLLVDDDESLRRALLRSIRLAGFDAGGYASVEALLAAGMPERDAVLVLDVSLPGIGGIMFKRTLIETGRDLPTIFITALDPRDVSGALASCAPIDVLYKPLRTDSLLQAIARAGSRP